MYWTKCLSFIALLGLVTSIAAQDNQNYLPLKVGLKWTYQLKDQKEPVYLLVSKTEKIGEQNCLRMDLKVDLTTALGDDVGIVTGASFIPLGRSRFVSISTEYVAILNDGIHRMMIDGNPIGPPVNFLKNPVKKGDTWKSEFKIKEKAGKVTYTADFEDIELTNAKYKNALLITGITEENGITTKMKNWYAPNVGMVKQVIESGKETIELELLKVEQLTEDDLKQK